MTGNRNVRDAAAAHRAISRALGPARRGRPSVLVLTHERPDGDAVGSCIALTSILRARGLRALAAIGGGVPGRFAFMEGADDVVSPPDVDFPPEVVISLDAADERRHGDDAVRLARRAETTVVIDHHASNARFGDVNWVDPGAAAVGEMIYDLSIAARWRLTPAVCEALYVALLTDTGRFSFANTTARAFAIAGALVARGVDPERVADAVYGSRPRGEWELEARLRASLKLADGGRIATVQLSARDFAETRTTPAAAQDFASLPRTLAGVDLGIFLYEIDGGARTKVGFRSVRAVDVNRLAAHFGGGGHPQAAGCVVDGGLAKARRAVLRQATAHVRNGSGRGRR